MQQQLHQNFVDLKSQCLHRCQTLQSEINVDVLRVELAEHADGFDSQATVGLNKNFEWKKYVSIV
jgi:hypothetical protein